MYFSITAALTYTALKHKEFLISRFPLYMASLTLILLQIFNGDIHSTHCSVISSFLSLAVADVQLFDYLFSGFSIFATLILKEKQLFYIHTFISIVLIYTSLVVGYKRMPYDSMDKKIANINSNCTRKISHLKHKYFDDNDNGDDGSILDYT